MNEDKKLISAIVIVAIAIFLVSGGTLAYWQWSTSQLQGTLVNGSPAVDLDKTKMYIDFPENELTNLYPTSDCDPNGTSSWVTEITIDNKTGVVVAPNFKLKVKIEDKNGNVITNVTNPGNSNPNRYYIKYAVTGENESCQNALATGRFDQATPTFSGQTTWYDSALITEQDDNGFSLVSSAIGSGVSFYGNPNAITKRKFRLYAWLDKGYTSVNTGTEVTDSMQDAKVTVSWSENSNLEQVKKTYKGEAVAIYSADDNSLRFYRTDDASLITINSQYNGRTVTNKYTGFENTTYESSSEVPWSNVGNDIKLIYFEDDIYPNSISYWFSTGLTSCQILDVTRLDTSKITKMNRVFSGLGVYANTEINGIENWNVSNVRDMSYMFNGYFGDPDLDLSGWNVSKVTDMSNMFSGEIYSLDISGWNTSKVTNMSRMFAEFNNSLTTLDLSDLDTSNVTNMSSMFSNSTSIQNLVGLEDWNVSNVVNMSSMFSYCSNLTELDLSGWNTSNVTDMGNMFQYCVKLTNLTISDWNTSNVTNMNGMLQGYAGNLLDLTSWNVCSVMSYTNFTTNAKGTINVPFFGDTTKCNGGNPA